MMLRIERTELTLIDAIEYDFHIKHPYTFMVPYFNQLMEGYAGTFYCLRCRLWGWVLMSPPHASGPGVEGPAPQEVAHADGLVLHQ